MVAIRISVVKKVSIKTFRVFKSFKFKVDKIIVSFSAVLFITITFNRNTISNRRDSLVDVLKLKDSINSEEEIFSRRIRLHERDLIYLLKRVYKY